MNKRALVSLLGFLLCTVFASHLMAVPVIGTQPAAVTVTSPASASFTVAATGTGTLTYQWRRNGFAITSATNATYTLASTSRTDADYYDCVVTDTSGSVASGLARLNVAPTAYPANLARDTTWDAMTEVVGGTGNSVLPISAGASVAPGGFYVGGQFTTVNGTPQTMLMRLTSAGAVDPTFTPPVLDNSVTALALQADGKLIVGGGFQRVNGLLVRSFLLRLTTSGAIDATFSPVLNSNVNAALIQSDGQIIIGGTFTTVNGVSCNRIARLNALDGSIDATFFLGTGFNSTVNALALQADGKLVVGGQFTSYNGIASGVNRLARLLTVGAAGLLDTTFNIGAGPDGNVNALAIQARDGAILVGGQFTNYNATPAVRLARISSTGALDATYNANLGAGPNSTVNAVALQGDTASTVGTAIIGGNFATVSGATRADLARITATGTLDTTVPAAPNSAVNAVALQADGRILLGGSFSTIGGATNPRNVFARLNSDLTIDTSSLVFTRNGNNTVAAVMPQPDGKVIVAGLFQFVRGTPTSANLARFNSNGSLDATFNPSGAVKNIYVTNPGTGYTAPPTVAFATSGATTSAVATATVLGGMVTSITITNAGTGYTSTPTVTITGVGTGAAAMVNTNGAGASTTISAASLLPDGRIAIAGNFTSFNGTTRTRIAIVKADGTLDTTFNAGGALSVISLTSGGTGYSVAPTVTFSGGGGSGAIATTVMASGTISAVNITNTGSGYTSSPTVTFSTSGATTSAVATATILSGVNGQVFTLVPLPPAIPGDLPRLFLGGSFTTADGVTRNRVAAIKLDGSLDATFSPAGTGADNNTVFASTVQPDGKIVIGGSFTTYGGTARAQIARIGADGALDSTFVVGTGFNSNTQVNALAYVFAPAGNAGQIIAAGTFTSYNGTTISNSPARIGATGALDTTFVSPGTNPNGGSGLGLIVQEDGAVIARGALLFSGSGGTGATGLIRESVATGARDTTFGAASFSATGTNFAPIAMLSDGRILTANNYTGLAASLPASAPSISVQPQNQTATVGGTATFNVTASATPAPSYQWLFNGASIAGATNSSYTVASAQLANVGSYSVIVSNELGSVTSSLATLGGAGPAPTISADPVGATVAAGASTNVVLNVTASGATGYQWLRNGVSISGATNSTYTIAGAKQTDSDYYSVIVANGLSIKQSAVARVVVNPTTYPNGLKPDPAFNLALETNAPSTAVVRAVLPDAAGGFYVAGDFTRFGGASGGTRSRVARFLASGALDTSFVPPSFDGAARALALDGAGNLLVGGSFFYVNGVARPRLVRLNATTGALDTTFNAFAGTETTTQVNALAVQSDGKILVGGNFASITGGSSTGANGFNRPALVRLNSDGSPDLGYDAKLNNTGSVVNALLMLSGDKLVVGGTFTSIAGATLNNLAILTSGGVVDSTFNAAGTGPGAAVVSLALDGTNLVIGGNFTSYGATSGVNRLARISLTGALDSTFVSGTGASNSVNTIVPLSGGGYMIGGLFTTYNGTARVGLAKVGATGTLDTAFTAGIGTFGTSVVSSINALALDSNGKLIVGGDFNVLASAVCARLGRLADTTTGAIDPTLSPDTLAPASAFAIAPQPGSGGKFLVLTNATRLAGSAIPTGLIRVDSSGALDASYNSGGSGFAFSNSGGTYRMLVLADGSAYVGGNFNTYNGVRRNFLARVKPDGTLDATFDPGTGPSNAPNVFLALPAGQVLVGGNFSTFNGTTRNGLVRLNSDGSIDTALQPPPSAITINAIALSGLSNSSTTPDKFYIGGTFTGTFAGIWNNTAVTRVARLNADGTLDTTFSAGIGPNGTVNAITVQPDGRVLLGGSFSFVNGTQRSGYARINSDGSVDRSFGTVFSAANAVFGFLPQSDGTILIKGTFGTVNVGTTVVSGADTAFVGAARGLSRITSTGFLDQNFGVYGFDSFSTEDFAVFDDGRVLLASGTPTLSFAGDLRGGLTLLIPQTGLALAQQPADRTVFAGQANMNFGVEAHNGVGALQFQWRKGGVNLTPHPRYQGIYSRALSFNDPEAADAGTYDCVVTDGTTSVTSRAAKLVVLAAAPTIGTPGANTSLDGVLFNTTLVSTTTAPAYTFSEGTPVVFETSATGTAPITYQWQLNGGDIAGATNPSLDLGRITPASAGSYALKATNASGTATSAAVTLALTNSTAIAPVILRGPPNANITLGTSVYLNTVAAGTGALSYQWQKKAPGGSTFTDITGATNSELLIPAVALADLGFYHVVITNATGSTTSGDATVSIANHSIWTPRHSLPKGTTIGRTAFGAGRYVALGTSGDIFTSTDSITWNLQQKLGNLIFADLAFGNGKFVAVGAAGLVATSSDGLAWSFGNINAAGASPVRTIANVVFDGTRFIASAPVAGAFAAIYTSTDGLTWTDRGSPASVAPARSGQFSGIAVQAFGNGTYVATDGYAGRPYIYTSTDLVTWTPRVLPTQDGIYVNHVIFSGGTFYAVGDSNLFMRSTDNGATWTFGDIDSTTTSFIWDSVAAANGKLVATNENGSFVTSTDGIKWTLATGAPVNLGTSGFVQRVTALNNQFIATGDGGIIMTSPDGANWAERFSRPLGLGTFTAVTYGGAGYLAVGANGQIASSTDGSTWVARDANISTSRNLNAVVYAGGKYFVAGSSGYVISSIDGVSWSGISLGGNNFNGICHDGTQFIAVGSGGRISTSPDSIAWTDRTSGTTATLRAVAAGGGAMVAVGDGVLLRSTDGITWTAPTTPVVATDVVRAVAYLNGQFMVVLGGDAAKTDNVLTSADGLTWNSRIIPFGQTARGLTYANGRYIVVGGSNSLLTSVDGVTWTADTSETSGAFQGVAASSNGFVAVGSSGVIFTAPAAPAPIIASVAPTTFGAATSVTITGSGFTGATGVSFNGVGATNITVDSDTQITATTPTTFTSGAVTVTTPGGTSVPLVTFTAFTAPSISTPPQDATIFDGDPVTFSVTATGIPTPTFQWKRKVGGASTFTNISGATSATYSISAATLADAGAYAVDVTNSVTTVTSVSATLTVNPVAPQGPTISGTFDSGLPVGATNLLAANVVVGTPPLTYAWQRNGVPIVGATNSSFLIRNAGVADTGAYTVMVSNTAGSAVSAAFRQDFTPELGWIPRSPALTLASFTAGLFANNQFVLGGTRGAIATSPDAVTWTMRAVPTASNLIGLAYGNSTYVALGTAGALFSSSDSVTWTARDSGFAIDATTVNAGSVVFGNGKFVAAYSRGLTSVSSDGLTWTAGTIGANDQVGLPTFVNGKFYVPGTGVLYVSTDGQAWTTTTLPTTSSLNQVTFGAGRYVAVGASGLILTSADGIAWALTASGTTQAVRNVAFANNQFTATDAVGAIFTSTDGLTWTARGASSFGGGFGAALFGNGAFVLPGGGANAGYYSSTSGTAWTASPVSVTSSNLRAVAMNTLGTMVAVGANGTIVTSPDGATWTSRASGVTSQLNDVAYMSDPLTSGLFVAVGNGGRILTSPDGISWTSRASSGANLIAVKFPNSGSNTMFTALGASGTILTSTDGVTWTPRTSGTTAQLSSLTIASPNGAAQRVAVGANGTILTSDDGAVTWVARTSGTTASLNDIVYGPAGYVAVGAGVVFTSTDGFTWTNRNFPSADTLNSVVSEGGVYLATATAVTGTATNSYWTSVDGVTWKARFTGAQSSWNDMIRRGLELFVVGNAGMIASAAAPVVSTPSNQSIPGGGTATFIAYASGVHAEASYQWQKKPLGGSSFADITGATANSLTLTNLTANDNGDYRLVASDSFGSGNSAAATLTALIAPAIATQPLASQTIVAPQAVTFSVVATGSPAPTYQWKKNTSVIPGATNTSYTIASTSGADSGTYTVTITNSVGSITSTDSVLTVNESAVITTPPLSQTIGEGQPVTFTVIATGIPAPTYQWKRGGTAIAGATNASYTIASVNRTDDGAQFTVTVGNSVNSLTSSAATLTVQFAPTVAISSNPAVLVILKDQPVTFTATTTGNPAPTVQWSKNGSPITGATNATLTIAAAQPADEGTYSVVATNTIGSASAATLLTVNFAPVISTPPANVVANLGGSATFSVTATGKPTPTYQWRKNTVAINGATNASLALTNLAATDAGSFTVDVTNSVTSITSTAATLTFNASIASFSPSSATLGATVTLNGVGFTGATAVKFNGTAAASFTVVSDTQITAVVPTYATTGSITVTTASNATLTSATSLTIPQGPRIPNGSILATVGTGENALMASFTIEGTAAKSMLIRAVGPGLVPFGVTGTLADPQLAIHDATGAIVASNDNWGGSTTIANAASAAGAFALSATSKDAVLLINLLPGTYTARVTGVGATTGTVLLEMYETASTGRAAFWSTRTRSTGSVTTGFTLGGTGTSGNKTVLIRAVGAGLGTAGSLANPTLTVLNGSTTVATNDNWAASADLTTATAAVGAMPLATNDSALLLTLAPGSYTVQVSGGTGIVTTEVFLVDGYRDATFAPALLAPLQDQTLVAGSSVTIAAPFVAKPATVAFQWKKNNTAISGATNESFTIASATTGDAGDYSVTMTNSTGATTAVAATLGVNTAPVITTQPTAQAVIVGQTATFTVAATGFPDPTFQWRRNGLNITGGTDATLSLTNISFDSGGTFDVVVTNVVGSVTSSGVTLTVKPVVPSITSPATASGVLGRTFSYQINANTTQATYGASGLPGGLVIDTASGVISGVPTATGSFNVTLTATNVSGSNSKVLALTIQPPPPIINSAASSSGRVGAAFSFTILAVNSPTSFAATGLPGGLLLNTTTGVISGTPTIAGTFTITLSATNSGGTSTSQFVLTIDPALNAPVYSGTTLLSGVQNSTFNFTPTFNTSGLTTTYTATGLPSGVTINASTGVISGTPTATGSFTANVTATSSGGATVTVFTFTVNPAPTAPMISSASAASGTSGSAFSFTLTASGTPTSFAAVGLPALGLSLNSTTGVISGTPSAPGTLTLQVSAANAVGTGPQSVLILTLNPSASAPIIDSASAVQGRVGDAFSTTLHASNSPTSFVVSSGTLPAGLALNATSGAITGTPTQVGQFGVWFAASNAFGPGYALQVNFNISPALTTPVVNSNGTAAGQVGQPLSYQISATNSPTSFAATGLPTGLALNTTTGVISGIPSEATTTALSISLTATNADGTSNPKILLLSIAPAPATPVITSALTASAQVGSAFSYQTTASDNATSFVALNLPAGLALNSTTGVLSGTPTSSGPFSVSLRASNAAGLGSPSTLVLSIAPAPSAPAITSAAAASGKVGISFTYTITTSGSATSYGLTGTLPLGLALNTSTGVISGKPAASGVFTVQLTATGAGGSSLPQSLVLNIAPADNAPVITSPIYASATVGQNFTYQVTASSSPAFPTAPFPAPFTLDAINLPAGLGVNPSTGVIQGQPTTAGVFTSTLVGTNSAGTGPYRDLTIFIAPAPTAPTVTSSPYAAGQVGTGFSYQITGTNTPTSYDVLGAPSWMAINSTSGALAGTPTTPGTFTVQLVATNLAGSSNSLALTMTIAPSANAPVVTSTRTAVGTVSVAFSYQITAAVPSGAPPVTSYIATGLPAGVSLNASTGVISGTPTQSGQFEITLIARNSAGDSQPVTLILTINPNLQFNGGT